MSIPTPSQGAADSRHAPEPQLAPADYSDYAEFLVHGKNEILSILRSLQAAVDRITLHVGEGRNFLPTALIAVDEDAVTLDLGADQEMNERALNADRVFCVTRHEKVRVQFVLRGLQQVDFQGRPAFRAALPDDLLRLQRREYYRLTTPIANPLKCLIPVAAEDGTTSDIEVQVADISGGGLAFTQPTAGMTFAKDMRFTQCRVELPEVGTLVATLQVKGVFEITLRSGGQATRVGCQFVRLPGPMVTLVQRYIIKVERERQARGSGIA